LQDAVSDAVGVRATVISSQPRILGELRTCLLTDEKMVAPDWPGFVRKIVRAMFSATDNTNERHLWRQCLNKAEELYATLDGGQRPNGSFPRRLYG
jgi:hypothetical protein